MTCKKLFDRIALIIIDQLRVDYEQYFPKCRNLLKYHAICDTNSIPTSTEAMHTNISTGKYPKDHGFISKMIGNKSGLEQLVDEKFKPRLLTPLSSIAKKYAVICTGTKSEVVQVLGLAEECALRIFTVKDKITGKEKLYADGVNFELRKQVDEFVRKQEYIVLPQERELQGKTRSHILIDIFDYVTRGLDEDIRFFYILALPSLDYLGHRCGPHSKEVITHLKFLDDKISEMIKFNKNTLFLIIGDHGCRQTKRYLIELKSDASGFEGSTYTREGDVYRYKGRVKFDSETIQDMSYDGGILRIWLKQGASILSKQDTGVLMQYGKMIDLRDEQQTDVEPQYIELIKNSRHINLGEIIFISDKDATFCKQGWVDKETVLKKKILQDLDLQIDELPIGEHGTYYAEDRHTLMMSNYDFEKSFFSNIQIREIISPLFD